MLPILFLIFVLIIGVWLVASQKDNDMDASDISCPVCGYYCLGKGGHGCIDKPSFFEDSSKLKKEKIFQEA